MSRKPSCVAAAIVALVRTWTPRSERILMALSISWGEEPARRLELRPENCSMTEIEFDGERRRLLRYNDLAPLPAE